MLRLTALAALALVGLGWRIDLRWRNAWLQLRRLGDAGLFRLPALAVLALVGFGLGTGAGGIAHHRAGLPRVGVAAHARVGGPRAVPAEFTGTHRP